MLGHEPSEPIDLPQQLRGTTAQGEVAPVNPVGNAAGRVEPRVRPPANITVTPPARTMERIER